MRSLARQTSRLLRFDFVFSTTFTLPGQKKRKKSKHDKNGEKLNWGFEHYRAGCRGGGCHGAIFAPGVARTRELPPALCAIAGVAGRVGVVGVWGGGVEGRPRLAFGMCCLQMCACVWGGMLCGCGRVCVCVCACVCVCV